MRPTVLFIEDNEVVRGLVTDALMILDAEVIACASTDEAIQIMHSESIDVLMTDLRTLGQIDGLQLVWLVAERWPKVQIIVTSGDTPNDALPSRSTFLLKPWTLDALHALVQQCLGKTP